MEPFQQSIEVKCWRLIRDWTTGQNNLQKHVHGTSCPGIFKVHRKIKALICFFQFPTFTSRTRQLGQMRAFWNASQSMINNIMHKHAYCALCFYLMFWSVSSALMNQGLNLLARATWQRMEQKIVTLKDSQMLFKRTGKWSLSPGVKKISLTSHCMRARKWQVDGRDLQFVLRRQVFSTLCLKAFRK